MNRIKNKAKAPLAAGLMTKLYIHANNNDYFNKTSRISLYLKNRKSEPKNLTSNLKYYRLLNHIFKL